MLFFLNVARYVLRTSRSLVSKLKRISLFGQNVKIDPTVCLKWSTSLDCASGEICIGKNTGLDIGVILRAYGGSIRIGSDCTINPYSILYGAGGLIIGDGVRIAAHCVIVASNHNFGDVDRFIHLQGHTAKGIVIADDVWIGAGAKILDGVVVAKGTIIAAGAVVTKSTVAYSIVAGVPARQIGSRT
jgi:acetyltransferase-like isoleucine patch superfamily enzyme